MLSTSEAASRRGVSTARIKQYVKDGRLPATKEGRDLRFEEKDVDRIAVKPPGKPRKQA